MNEYVSRLHRAARTSDYAEMRQIIVELALLGFVDPPKVDQLTREVNQPSTLV